jgi:hypothetical protein
MRDIMQQRDGIKLASMVEESSGMFAADRRSVGFVSSGESHADLGFVSSRVKGADGK